LRGRGVQQRPHPVGQGEVVGRVEIEGGVGADLPGPRDVGGDHGAALNHGLQRRDAEAFVQAGEDQPRRAAQEGGDLRVRAATGQDDAWVVGHKRRPGHAGQMRADQHQPQVWIGKMGQGAGRDGEVLVRRKIADGDEVASSGQVQRPQDFRVRRDVPKMIGAVRRHGDGVGRQVQHGRQFTL